MENQRLLLFVALSVVILLLWQAWQKDFGTPPQATAPPSALDSAAPSTGDVPAIPAAGNAPVPAPAATATAVPADAGLDKGERIQIRTDEFLAEIDTRGGDLRDVKFLNYSVSVNQPDQPFQLLNDASAKIFIAQSGLLAASVAPNHHAQYQVAQKDYKLADGATELKVPLTWVSDKGITVTKTPR